jgi:hypothetical protein
VFKHDGEADEHPSAKVLSRSDGGFSHGLHAAMADGHDKGAEDTRQAAVDVKKKKVERSKDRWNDGGFGYDLRAAMAALQDRGGDGAKEAAEEVVEEEHAKEVVVAEAK